MSRAETYQKNMRCLDRWMSNRENGKWIADYLNTFHIHKIAIYGYGILGRHLVRELQEKKYPISWVMDKSSLGNEKYSEIIRPEELENCKEKADITIITSLSAVEEVEKLLLGHVSGKVIAIDELIDSIYVWGSQD